MDFGCGEGLFAAEVIKRGARAVHCIDQNETMLAKAALVVPAPATFTQGGLESLAKLPDASADCLLAINVIAYMTNEEEDLFYREFTRIVGSDPSALLTRATVPERLTFNIRENPLAYTFKLRRYGVEQTKIEFINYHSTLPLLSGENPDDMARERRDTLDCPAEDRWKLQFQCSMFGVQAVNCRPCRQREHGL